MRAIFQAVPQMAVAVGVARSMGAGAARCMRVDLGARVGIGELTYACGGVLGWRA